MNCSSQSLQATGTSVERISVTPPADMCFAPAKTEVASGILSVMPNELLGPTNPCKIPEKALHREKTRCKHCLTFSRADVVMQMQCGTQSRLIRSAILDRAMFDVAANTPEHTAWTMRLLQRLNSAVGPSGFEKQQIFPLLSVEPLPSRLDSSTMQDLAAGRYDSLFEGAPDKPSDLYRASQIPPAVPEVRLIRSFPLWPNTSVKATYPPLARLAHIQDTVSFKLAVDTEGAAKDLVFESGNPLLRGTVENLVRNWKFPKDSTGQQIEATIEFSLNCPKTK